MSPADKNGLGFVAAERQGSFLADGKFFNEGGDMPAKVDVAKCSGCAKCVEVCPNGAIKIENEKAKVSDECIDCGACECDCPNQAISMA